MPVPKRKRSKSRRDKRFANKGLLEHAITRCKNCQEPLTPHQACKGCGFYKGAKVIATKSDRAVKRTETKSKEAQSKQEVPATE